MATIKLLLRRQKTKDNGTAPIYLRLTKDRKAQFISLNVNILEKDWDEDKQRVKKSHPNSNQLNAFLSQKVAEAENLCCAMISESKRVQTYEIKQELIGVPKPKTDIFKFAERYYKVFRAKDKYGTYTLYKSVFAKLSNFVKGKPLFIEDLNVSFLKDYENYLRSEVSNKQNTIHTSMKSIRRVINVAIEEDIIPYDKNPFLKYRIVSESVEKTFLTDEEIHKLEVLKCEQNSILDVHRDAFIFSTYAGGLRISDICLLRWENFHNGYITVNTMKTGTTVTIKLPNKALAILEKYKTETVKPKQYIFSLIDNEADINEGKIRLNCIQYADVAINKSLKKMTTICNIEKRVTFHTARHTFATRALRKGMRIEYVSKLMAHSDIKLTQVYAKIVNEDLDKAMEKFND
jgi:integrase/recombinase XerD